MNAPALDLDARVLDQLGEAHAWRLIGLLFERPRGSWWDDIANLASSTTDPLLHAAAELARTAREGDYLALLGPSGVVSPREAGYRKTADPARVLAAIRAFHAAFAFQPASAEEGGSEDPLDHVAVQASFVAWLHFKEAFARAHGDTAAGDVTAEAARRYVTEHLAVIAEPLSARLEAQDSGHVLLAARALLARTGPRPAGVEGDWVPHGLDVEGCTLACGLAGDVDESETELPPEFTAGLPPGTLAGGE